MFQSLQLVIAFVTHIKSDIAFYLVIFLIQILNPKYTQRFKMCLYKRVCLPAAQFPALGHNCC